MGKNVPILHTKRLTIRNICEEDTDNIVRWKSNVEVYKFFLNPHKITKEEHNNWLINYYYADENRYDWVIFDKQNIAIGVFGFKRDTNDSKTAEISYIIDPARIRICKGSI